MAGEDLVRLLGVALPSCFGEQASAGREPLGRGRGYSSLNVEAAAAMPPDVVRAGALGLG